MLISALICMIVASILAAIGLCFTSKKQAMHFLLYTFFLVGLCCVGFIALNFKNTFQAYSILLIIAVLPNFLMLFDMNLEEKNNTQEISISSKKLKNFWNQTNFLLGISSLASAFCIGFAGFYLGKETPYGFLVALPIALGAICFQMTRKKKILFDVFGDFILYLAIGIIFGQILSVIIYAQTLKNFLYCLGGLIFMIYCLFKRFWKNSFNQIVFATAMIVLFLTIII